jgi:hypothetical protein
MTAALKQYSINKIISLGWVFVVIILTGLWLGFIEPQWQLILLILITFGYAHFLVGFFYQVKSFWRKPNPWQHVLVFLVLTLVTLIGVSLIFSHLGYGTALFIGFIYFLLHGLFNEQTLIQREAGIFVPLIYISSLAVFIMSLLTYTVPDPTFLFTRSLEFIATDNFIFAQLFKAIGFNLSIFPYLFWCGILLSFIILFFAWWQSRRHQLTLFLLSSYVLILLPTIIFGALPYIYMYFVVIGYHFMTWFLFFLREFARRSRYVLVEFLSLHLLVLAPFVVGGWLFFTPVTPEWVYVIFDYKYFVVATYIHISTSFMNDAWFQRFQEKILS